MISRKITDPREPDYSNYESEEDLSGDLVMLGIVLFFAAAGFWLMQWSFLLGLVPLGVAGIIVFGIVHGDRQEKKLVEEKYETAIACWKDTLEKNERARKELPKFRMALQCEQKNNLILQSRLQEVQTLRQSLYDVNIIPKQHRNIYAACYLYDYFSTCRENDLEKIIQTMLLDEIKKKLDKIIAQNEKIILNQRIQLALQEQSNQIAAEHHRMELDAIVRLEQNQELQLDYQNMIVQNQVVTNFLLAADYLYR